MNDLPKVFANKIDKEINNSQDKAIIMEGNNVNFEDILSNERYSFNHRYKIVLTNNQEIEDSIIQITREKVLTIDNGWIGKNSIKSIIEIKK